MTVAISKELEDLRDGCTVDEDGCWVPSALHERQKHGHVLLKPAGYPHRVSAHRLAYTEWIGSVPEGEFVRHTCKTKDCFNPKHLFTAPPKEIKVPKRTLRQMRREMRDKLNAGDTVGGDY